MEYLRVCDAFGTETCLEIGGYVLDICVPILERAARTKTA